MASKYWIKLYHEILDDPKMGTMPDRLWRRTIELFLVAGEFDYDGLLPSVRDVAYRLRLTDEELLDDLNYLINEKIISQREDGIYYVTKFVDRQDPMSKAEYMRRKRDDIKRKEYYDLQYGDHRRKLDSESANDNDGLPDALRNSYQSVTRSNAGSNTDKIRLDEIRKDKNTQYSGGISEIDEKDLEKIEQQYIDWFCEIARVDLPINQSQFAKWIQQVAEWIALGVEREDIQKAIEISDEKALSVVRPASITNIIKSEMAYRKRGGNHKNTTDENVITFTDPNGRLVAVRL